MPVNQRFTTHAEERRIAMRLNVNEVLQVVEDPVTTYPGYNDCEVRVRDELAVVVSPNDTIVTVLWNGEGGRDANGLSVPESVDEGVAYPRPYREASVRCALSCRHWVYLTREGLRRFTKGGGEQVECPVCHDQGYVVRAVLRDK